MARRLASPRPRRGHPSRGRDERRKCGCVCAYEREKAWAPDCVAPELSGTLQAAQRHHAIAQLPAAEAEQEGEAERQAQLEREVADARALADLLDWRVAELECADEVRALWYAHAGRDSCRRATARTELGARAIDPDQPERATTAQDWPDAQDAGAAAEDEHRPVTHEAELRHRQAA
jgi:hypothetical protein